ncbi:MAG: glycoside hydrolase family 2 TIM barrel-domain containing protein [Paludibacter sp.]|nr:glycoside hydrolase family 2 TIM barrel-domain containing protein [Paludibacter sp.]
MKTRSLFLLLFLLCIGSISLAQKETVSLNGTWKFKAPVNLDWGTYGTIATVLSELNWDSVQVPGNWDTKKEYANYTGEAAYYRTFEVPETWAGNDLFIHFDAVYYTAKVYVNGNYVGKHEGGYTPFEFCVSDFVRTDTINELIVLVNNEFSRGAWWSWGGISRNVAINSYKQLKTSTFHITAIPDFTTGRTEIALKTSIENLSTTTKELTLKISFDDRVLPTQSTTALLGKYAAKTFNSTFIIKTDSLRLWHFDDPNLYTATLEVLSNNELVDIRKVRFGVRKVEVKGTQFFLNDEPIRAFGFNRISDHRTYGNTEPIELIKRDIDEMKSLGCVMTRIMHYPQSPDLLDYCDEKGILIIQEIPVWGKFDPNSYHESPVAKHWLNEMIERDYNHPSIIGWSVANEIGIDAGWKDMRMSKEQFRYIQSMIRHVKSELDSTRLITYASFTAFRENATDETEPAGMCDFISFNSYGDMPANCKDIHAKWPDKPIFISEFGRGMIGEDLNTADIDPKVIQLIHQVQELPYVIGASLWSYNDYRSRYRGTPESGNRSWGVVDVWRNRKKAANTIQELFCAVNNFEVRLEDNSLLISITPRTEKEIPSYKLQNYQIRMISSKGKTIDYSLPELPVNSKIYSKRIKLDYRFMSGNNICIQLITPTGITISERKLILKK